MDDFIELIGELVELLNDSSIAQAVAVLVIVFVLSLIYIVIV